MDGRLSFLRGIAGVVCVAGACLLSRPVFGQAMGKVTLDPGTSAVAATAPVQTIEVATPAAAPVTAPVVVAPVLAGAESKTITPIPAPVSVPLPTPATMPAITEPKVSGKAEIAPDKAPADSLPADASKAVAPLRPIEHQEIHPRTAEVVDKSSGEASKSAMPPGIMSVLQVGAALAVVIGLILIGKAAARKFLPSAKAGNGKGVIEILARYPLSKNQSLVLVRIGSQIVTLNQGKDQSQSVLVINDPNEVARILGQIEGTSPKSIQAGFNKLLSNARMDLEDPANDPDQPDFESRSMEPENLDTQLEEMAAAKRQLMELRQQVRSVRDSLPR